MRGSFLVDGRSCPGTWELSINLAVRNQPTCRVKRLADLVLNVAYHGSHRMRFPDRFGNNSPDYFQTVAHQIRRGLNGKVLDYTAVTTLGGTPRDRAELAEKAAASGVVRARSRACRTGLQRPAT